MVAGNDGTYSIKPDGFDKYILMDRLTSKGVDGQLGWRFRYGAKLWDTNMEDHCKAGERPIPGARGRMTAGRGTMTVILTATRAKC